MYAYSLLPFCFLQTEYEFAMVLIPISSSSIAPNGKGGFKLKDPAVAKHIADVNSETQVNLYSSCQMM